MLVWSVLLGLTVCLVQSARPDPPASGITTVGSLKLATAEDCAGVVAFSAIKGSNPEALLIYDRTLVNKAPGYAAETGIFTTHCPGLYQFSFAGYGSSDLHLTLKVKVNKSDNWSAIASAGPSGGANMILYDAEVGDQFGVYVDTGYVASDLGTTFTGLRVAKK